MKDYTNVAVNLCPNGVKVSPEVFKAVMQIKGNTSAEYFSLHKDRPIHLCDTYVSLDYEHAFQTPTEILGQSLMDAIADGYTPWFVGDDIPHGEGTVWFKGLSSPSYNTFKNWRWSQSNCSLDIIAYKKEAPTMPLIESKILAEKVTAAQILESGLSHMKDRSLTYDKPDGERSMGATVEAFESITGHSLTEEQGWLFMGVLKMVRSQQGGFKLDNYEDEAAYAALRGECAARSRK